MSDPRIEPAARALEKSVTLGIAGPPSPALARAIAADFVRALDASPDLALVPREQAALGVAWARAEAALPETWERISLDATSFEGDWHYVATGHAEGRQPIYAYGPTPTAALRALREQLEARR